MTYRKYEYYVSCLRLIWIPYLSHMDKPQYQVISTNGLWTWLTWDNTLIYVQCFYWCLNAWVNKNSIPTYSLHSNRLRVLSATEWSTILLTKLLISAKWSDLLWKGHKNRYFRKCSKNHLNKRPYANLVTDEDPTPISYYCGNVGSIHVEPW
jgi:hypothetical protein